MIKFRLETDSGDGFWRRIPTLTWKSNLVATIPGLVGTRLPSASMLAWHRLSWLFPFHENSHSNSGLIKAESTYVPYGFHTLPYGAFCIPYGVSFRQSALKVSTNRSKRNTELTTDHFHLEPSHQDKKSVSWKSRSRAYVWQWLN